MQWTPEAEAAIAKVPFFVRKSVRRRVENEAASNGKNVVSLDEVKATQQRYLAGMASEVKGYQLDVCFGSNGCPNRAMDADELREKIDQTLKAANLLGFLRQQVGENFKFHHEFRVTISECPNACSQPQIKDIGIIGARHPAVSDAPCSGCDACRSACPDHAIPPGEERGNPTIDFSRCLSCGKCISACATGTILESARGYKVLLAGKLGRHPRLARALPGIFGPDEVIAIVEACIDLYKKRSRGGKRFAEIFTPEDYRAFAGRFAGSDAGRGIESRCFRGPGGH